MSSPITSDSTGASESTASNNEFVSFPSLTETPPRHHSVVVFSGTGTSRAGARHATVYDAVAGRVKSTGSALTPNSSSSKASEIRQKRHLNGRKTVHSTRSAILPPADVLFRRRGAPLRYAELDIYRQDEHLPPHTKLPDSDLVKSVHSYAASAYKNIGRTQWDEPGPSKRLKDAGGTAVGILAKTLARQAGSREQKEAEEVQGQNKLNADLRSMDETALLAFGILLEEAGRSLLGKRGDMVMTEGLDVSEDGEERVVGIEEGDIFWKRKMRRPVRKKDIDEEEPGFMDTDAGGYSH